MPADEIRRAWFNQRRRFPGRHAQWGLSFLINPEPLPTGRSAGSLAWAGLANSYYWIDPVKQVAGVYATQLLPFYDAQAVSLFGAFESVVYDMTG